MFKKGLFIVTALIFLFSAVGVTFALEKGNDRKGKYTYRKVYKACNERGEVNSPKPPISPDAKTQAQWTRVFEKKDFADFGCKAEWDSLSEADLMDIYAYLHDHAADSPTPAKCK
ncbi:MAG: cytochrome c family protein [Deltaproteobacteria bacterium]|nr:cytochrome c family protein [Deltaproteobacteria bacterium]